MPNRVCSICSSDKELLNGDGTVGEHFDLSTNKRCDGSNRQARIAPLSAAEKAAKKAEDNMQFHERSYSRPRRSGVDR